MTAPVHRDRSSFIPRVEALEDRCVPAGTIREVGTQIRITGDNNNNLITIADLGTNSPGNIILTLDGRTHRSRSAVQSIRVQLLGGSDVLTYSLAGTLVTGASRRFTVDMGAGNDNAFLTLSRALAATTSLRFNVRLGDGVDFLQLNSAGANVSAGSELRIDAFGGDGNDRIQLNYSGGVFGTVRFTVHGEGGSDRLEVNATPSQGSTGLFRVNLFGGKFLDELDPMIRRGFPGDTIDIFVLADGGEDVDVCQFPPGINPVNCEYRFQQLQ